MVVVVLGPGPEDDVFLWLCLEEVGESFPVAVPEFATRDHPADGPSGNTLHDCPSGKVKPDDGVGSGENQIPNERAVVPVNDPLLGLDAVPDDLPHPVAFNRRPVLKMMDPVEFDVVVSETR